MIDEENPIWVTKDFERIKLRNMRTQHIMFSLAMIRRRAAAGRPWRARWVPIFEAELERRQQTVEGFLQQAFLQRRH